MITVDTTHGNAIIYSDATTPDGLLQWWLNGTIANGTSTVVDGAKRDRLVWSADMSISVPAIAVSTYDLISIQTAFDALFGLQSADGQLPYGGFPFNLLHRVSFTYHLFALIGVRNLYHWSGDQSYLDDKWPQWKAAMDWAVAQIDDSGLANVTSPYDWLRYGMGGHNVEANTLLFYTLSLGVDFAQNQNDSATADRWSQLATGVQSAAQTLLWQPDVGLFKDNETTTLAPQDGNTWAVKSGLVTNASQIVQISEALQARWGPYGAPSPEVDAVSPFTSSLELETHFMANRTAAALALIRTMWADFMLDDPRMTNSTLIEGYSMDGSLHYPAYASDAVISHAHGFSTGPTGSLMVSARAPALDSVVDSGAHVSRRPTLAASNFSVELAPPGPLCPRLVISPMSMPASRRRWAGSRPNGPRTGLCSPSRSVRRRARRALLDCLFPVTTRRLL